MIAGSTLSAQTNIDSLIRVLNPTKIDSIKSKTLINLVSQYLADDKNKAKLYIGELRKLSKAAKNEKYLIEADILESKLFAVSGNLDSSNIVLIKVSEKYDVNKYPEQNAQILLTLGLNYNYLGKYDTAAAYFNQSVSISKKYNYNFILINNYIGLGIMNSDLGNLDATEKYLLLAEDLSIKNKFEERLANIYNNLVNIYINKNKIEVALDYINKAITINEKLGNNPLLAIAYHNKGALLFEQKKYSEVLDYLNKSLEIKRMNNDKIGMATSHLALGEVYRELKNWDQSIYNLKIALQLFSDKGILKGQMNVYSALDSLYNIKGDYNLAYYNLKNYNIIKDSLFTENREKIIAELNTKYDIASKENENLLLKSKTEQQNFIIYGAIIILIIITFGSVLLYRKNRSIQQMNKQLEEDRKEIERQNIDKEVMNVELAAINNQLIDTNDNLKKLNATKDKFFSIISHDLKSPVSSQNHLLSDLNNNYDSFTEEERREYFDLLNESSKNTFSLLENLLTWGKVQMQKIDINPELFNLHYLVNSTLTSPSFSAVDKGIVLINDCPEDLQIVGDVGIISTMLRNLVNNSIKFTKEGGSVTVSYKSNANEHQITVKDTGVGMKPEQVDNLFRIDKTISTPGTRNEKGTGLGLIICKDFIEMQNGRIWVESKLGEGSAFHFTIPVAYNPEK